MFSPAKSDLSNDESDVTDINQPTNIIELHPKSSDASPDIKPEKPITVSEFCKLHNITSDQFLALRRKAARKHSGIDFKPIREGSRTFWVQNATILTDLIEAGATDSKLSSEKSSESEALEGEIIEAHQLSDGSSLVVRKRSLNLSLPAVDTPKTREITRIDFSELATFNESVEADLQAEREAERLAELAQFAMEEGQKQEQKRAITNLIAKGYTPEQAVRIVMGIN